MIITIVVDATLLHRRTHTLHGIDSMTFIIDFIVIALITVIVYSLIIAATRASHIAHTIVIGSSASLSLHYTIGIIVLSLRALSTYVSG
jgi:hypothetical protein